MSFVGHKFFILSVSYPIIMPSLSRPAAEACNVNADRQLNTCVHHSTPMPVVNADMPCQYVSILTKICQTIRTASLRLTC